MQSLGFVNLKTSGIVDIMQSREESEIVRRSGQRRIRGRLEDLREPLCQRV